MTMSLTHAELLQTYQATVRPLLAQLGASELGVAAGTNVRHTGIDLTEA
jgi:hypothetical protein